MTGADECLRRERAGWRWAVTAAYLGLLLVGTHLSSDSPAVETAIETTRGDKPAHFLGYFGLAALVFGLCGAGRTVWTAATILAGFAALSAADELTQPYFGRSAEWLDWSADLAGILLGCLAAVAIRSWLKNPGVSAQ